MAEVKKVTLKRFNGTDDDTLHPTTEWEQVENKPSTFTPTAHTLNSHTDVDANPTADGQVLTWDAANNIWVASDSTGGGDVSKSDLQNLYIYGKASGAITIGQAVQFAGAQGGHTLIKRAVPSEINAEPTLMIGIAETDLANNEFGYVIVNGRLNLDTSDYDAGDLLYFASAGSTAGALTTTEPTDPNASIQMAAVSIDGVGNGEFIIRNTILTRQINEVIGLQGALDSKVNKSGDTMTGNLTISTGALTSALTLKSNSGYNSQVLFNNGETLRSAITSIDADGNLAFYHNGGDKLVIDNSGKVGIGTTSPGYNLDVYKNSSDVNPTFRLQNAGANAGSGINLSGNNNAANSLIWHNGAVNALMFQTDTATYDANKIAMTIDSSQNVGIGTTTPNLTNYGVELSISAVNKTTQPEAFLNIEGNRTTDTNIGAVRYLNNGNGVASIFARRAGANNGGSLFFETATAGTSSIKMSVLNDGNVGIGTASPLGKLDLFSTASQDVLRLRHDAVGGGNWGINPYIIGISNAGLSFIDRKNSTTPFVISDGGNVGIGTTSPISPLHIVDGTTKGLEFDEIGGGVMRILAYDRTENEQVPMELQSSTLLLDSDDVTVAGNFTIQGNLNITGTYTQIDTDVNTTEQWLVTNDGTGPAAIINQKGAQPVIDIQDDGVSAFYIEDGGNVGIGTTDPARKLHIKSGTNDIGILVESSDQFAKISMKDNTTTSDAQVMIVADGNDMFLEAGSAERIRIKSTGNVGIGTASPAVKLHTVSNNTDYQAKFQHDGTTSGYAPGSILLEAGQANSRGQGIYHYNTVADENWFTGVPYAVSSKKWIVANQYGTSQLVDTAQLQFALLTIDSDTGNVGIGTTSPSTMLHIEYPSYIGKDTVQGVLRITGQSNTENTGDIPSAGTAIEFYNRWTGGAEYSVARIAGRGSSSYDGGLQFDVAQNTAPGQSNFVNAMTILKTGNVGIGTASPTTKLDVSGVIRNFQGSGGMTLSGYATPDLGYLGYNYYNNNGTEAAEQPARDSWRIQFGNGATKTIGFGHRQANAAAGTFTEYMTIANSGNIGIGTASPTATLHLRNPNARLRVGPDYPADGNGSDRDYIDLIANGQDTRIVSPNERFHIENPAGKIVLTASGGVGVGTTNPSTRLSLNQAGTTVEDGLWVYSGDNPSAGGIALFKSGAATGAIQSLGANSSLKFITNAGGTNYERMRINANGVIDVFNDARTLYGPNSTWSRYLSVGGNGYNGNATTGSVSITSGNLHLDPAAGGYTTYLSFYAGTGGTAFGNGTAGIVAWMGSDGDLWKGSLDNTGSQYWHAGNLTKSLTYTLLGNISLTTGTDTLNISASNGLNSVVVIEAEVFNNGAVATWTGPLGEIGTSATYKSNLWSTTRYTDFWRNSAGTQIYFSGTGTNNVYRARVYELKVA